MTFRVGTQDDVDEAMLVGLMTIYEQAGGEGDLERSHAALGKALFDYLESRGMPRTAAWLRSLDLWCA